MWWKEQCFYFVPRIYYLVLGIAAASDNSSERACLLDPPCSSHVLLNSSTRLAMASLYVAPLEEYWPVLEYDSTHGLQLRRQLVLCSPVPPCRAFVLGFMFVVLSSYCPDKNHSTQLTWNKHRGRKNHWPHLDTLHRPTVTYLRELWAIRILFLSVVEIH